MDEIAHRKPSTYVGPQSRLARSACRALFGLMLNTPRIHVELGDGSVAQSESARNAEFVILPPDLWTTLKILLAPNLWVGESYVTGQWYLAKGNLADFLEAIRLEAKSSFESYYRFIAGFKGIRYFLRQYLFTTYYTRKVKTHYDVDTRVYELFLDEEMLYTCAFFLADNDGLREAQQKKLAVTIERLCLPDGHRRVLDIGCGWGGLARALVKRYPAAEVCGLTISDSQLAWARERDAKFLTADQSSRIVYRNEDYLDHDRCEHYDAISVVGMIEHVGLSGYDRFFQKIHDLLRPGGYAVVHTIVSPAPARPANAWIDRHIFTGGHAPSISEVARAVEQQCLRIEGIYVYPPRHYRRTIEAWLANFQSNVVLIEGYLRERGTSTRLSDQFIRMWVFYLSGVRNMFVENRQGSYQVAQIQLRRL
jgi:cyclopropane-fatty-acyl-phospholipid synthase